MAGCPGVEKVEFTIFSKNVVDSPAYVWTEEGSVKMIKMEVSHSELNHIPNKHICQISKF